MVLPGTWTIQAGKGLGEHPSHPLTCPMRRQGSKRICPGLPMPPTSMMPPATSSVWCFYSAALMVVNSLRTGLGWLLGLLIIRAAPCRACSNTWARCGLAECWAGYYRCWFAGLMEPRPLFRHFYPGAPRSCSILHNHSLPSFLGQTPAPGLGGSRGDGAATCCKYQVHCTAFQRAVGTVRNLDLLPTPPLPVASASPFSQPWASLPSPPQLPPPPRGWSSCLLESTSLVNGAGPLA